MKQLHGTGRNSERKLETIGDSEPHAANLWQWERKPAKLVISVGHAATP